MTLPMDGSEAAVVGSMIRRLEDASTWWRERHARPESVVSGEVGHDH